MPSNSVYGLTGASTFLLELLCLLLLSMASGSPLYANSCSTNAGYSGCNPYNDPGSALRLGQPDTQAGNPVDVLSGNKYQGEIDYQAGDSFLMFKRHYNSVNASYNLNMGYGWRSTYDVHLAKSGDSEITIAQSDGRLIQFFKAENSDVYNARNINDGYVVVEGANSAWRLPEGRIQYFKGSYLVKISILPSHELSLQYNNGKLHSVTDEKNRVLQFTYYEGQHLPRYPENNKYTNHTGHLKSIVLPDQSEILYFYDKRQSLRKVVHPDGLLNEYKYADGFYSGLLTGRDSGEEKSQWEYNAEGRIKSHHDHISGIRLQFSYEHQGGDGLQANAGSTIVVDNWNTTTRYNWQWRSDLKRYQLIGVSGRTCRGCPVVGDANFSTGTTDKNAEDVNRSSTRIAKSYPRLKYQLHNVEIDSTDLNGYPKNLRFQSRYPTYTIDLDINHRGEFKGLTPSMALLTLASEKQGADSIKYFQQLANQFGEIPDVYILNKKEGEFEGYTDNQESYKSAWDSSLVVNTPDVFDPEINPWLYTTPGWDIEVMEVFPLIELGGAGSLPRHVDSVCYSTLNCSDLLAAMEAFELASCSYGNGGCFLPTDWEMLDPVVHGFSGLTDVGEFRARVFRNIVDGRIMIGFSGSHGFADYRSGVEIATGTTNFQTRSTSDLTREIRILFPNSNIEVTGHSLGGALATIASSEFQLPATIFGSPSVDDRIFREMGINSASKNLIAHYFVESDLVVETFSTTSFPNVVTGRPLFTPINPHIDALTFRMTQPQGQGYGGFEAHSRTSVRDTLKYHFALLKC